ncbi:MAG: filamentous hemagglutinin N-terminal domain-containing protein [Alphaproteobacteria bacterium]|nr:filamentous hemagglutinin N-terminal domain-containing protein [Alphaproteobacteria bacterium]
MWAGPEGGQVTGGSASIQQDGSTTTINQSSSRAIIKWSKFDLDASDHVKFQQPGRSSITVNRITDSKASRINGKISANGNIVLINPNGMVFGSTAVVDVGGLVATTSDLKDDDAFLAGGKMEFTKPGKPDARIINNGKITAKDAGLVGLIAPHVENHGVIQAKLGKVQLASGDIHTIDFAGDGLIKLEVSADVLAQSVTNTGTIEADGGQVLLTTAQARHIVESLITNTGTIRANTVNGKKGSIKISTKGLEDNLKKGNGTIINTGALIAEAVRDNNISADQPSSSPVMNALGGDITLLAESIQLGDGSVVSATGDHGGGMIRIGGDYQGGNNVPTSDYIFVSQQAILNASSRRYGKGGTIILWSDENTVFYGNAYATGGNEGGDGGLIEVSGKNTLTFEGHIDLRAPHGKKGVLLLDPTNITISSGVDAAVTGSSPFTPNADNATSVLNATTLLNALANGNVIVQTRATGAQTGNITVDAALSWNSGSTLTLDAHANIIVNQAINGGGLTLIAGTDVQLNANIGGTGALTMQAAADGTTMGIGASAVGVFNLNTTDLPFIQDGWSDIIIGRSTGTGAIDIRATTWSDNLTLQTGSGTININGIVNTGANNLTFMTDGNINLAVANGMSGSGTLTLMQQTASAAVGMSSAAGAINLNNTEIGRIADGWSQINIGRADGSGTMTFGTSSATWKDNVTINSGTGALIVSGAQTFGANAVNIVTDGDISLNVTNALYAAGGTLAITQRSPGTSIGLGDSQAGDITLSTLELTRLRDGFTQITIGRTDGTADLNIGNSTFTDPITIQTGSGKINLNTGTLTTSTNALVLSTNGADITIGSTISQSSGALTLSSAGGAININSSITGTTTGTWNFDSANGALTVSGNITKTGGTVNFSSGTGALIINNALSFGAAASNFTTSGAAGIILHNTLSASTGAVTMNTAGGNITLNNALNFTSTGALNLNSNGGSITTQGITQTTGATSINSGGGLLTIGGTLTKTGGTTTIDSGTGQLTLNTVTLGAGSLSLITDSDITLNGNLNGTGTFSLAAASDNVSMAVGTGETGTILVDDDEFSRILDGWSSRTLGRTDSTATLNVKGGLDWLDTLILQTGSGTISLNGAQTFNANSFTIRTDADINFGGNLSGTGTVNLTYSSPGTSLGIGDGQAGTISLSDADLALFLNGWGSRIFGRTDATGDINIGAITWVDPVTLRTGSGQINVNGPIVMTGGNALTFSTDSDLTIGANVTGSGSGATLTIVGSSAATTIGIGDGQAGMLQLDNTELSRFGSTWNSIIIGSTTATGEMNVGGRTWSDPLTLRTGTGQMNINGNIVMGGNNLALSTDSDLALNGTLSGTGSLTISPVLSTTAIGLGNGQGGDLVLDDTELDLILNGFNAITIGSTASAASMNVGARTWNDHVTLRTGSGALNINGAQNTQTNNLTLTTNSNIAINDILSGTGTLTISGSSSATSIGVGTGQSGTLSLSDGELDNIATGWTSVIIGTTSVTGAMNIAGRTWNNPMEFRTNTGALNINGAQNLGTNNLTIRTATDLSISQILAGTGTLTIMNSQTGAGNTMAIGTSQTGQLKLTDAELAFFADQGWSTLSFGNTGSTGAINIDAKSWNANVLFRNSTGGININGAQTLSAGKNLTITSNGDIAINQALNGSGTLTLGATSATISMGVGDGGSEAVLISNTELARISSGWNELVFGMTGTTTSTYGTLNIRNYAWNNNVKILNNLQPINIAGATMGTKNLTITTNGTLNINGNLNGSGILTIAPQAVATTIGVGGTGTLNLTEAEMQRFVDGWSSIVIGRTDGTGTMNVAARTWNDNVTLITGTGAMNISGATMGSNNLTLITNSNLAINGNITGTGNLKIRTASGLTGIGVGDLQTGTLALSNAELARIVDGWNNVTIGDAAMFGAINIGAYNWVDPMVFVAQGNIVINGAQTTTETSGTTLVYATTGGAFINNAGVSAIDPNTGRYLVYSVASASDTLGGLTPLTIVNDESFTSYAPADVVEAGNVFIYSGLAAKILFLVIDDKDKVYGDANPAFTYSYLGGLQGSDTLADVVLTANLSAAGSTVLDDAGVTRTITGVFTAGLGYIINVIDGVLTVVKATLTVTADSDTRIYGNANPGLGLTYSGFKNGNDETDLDTEASVSTLADAFSNVGTYAITASGAADDNYDFIYVDGTLSITKATLTATTQNATREYGEANPAMNIVYTGFKNGETSAVIDTLATASSVANATSNVGNYAITGTGAIDNNYNFIYANTGILSVTKATLTATTQNATREYGDANPALSVVYTGFKNSETSAVIDTLASASTIATQASNVGLYSITATGATDNNYNFTYVNSGNLDITKAAITVQIEDKSRIYGEANPAFTLSYSGFKNGQDSSVFTAQATASSTADVFSNAGSYAITGSGATADNYDFTYANGTLTVGKATLTATAGNGTREYGDANPTFDVTYAGFVNGDDEADIDTLAIASSAGTSANVGTHAVIASGALDNNYIFTYVDGSLTITKATLTATADNAAREMGNANSTFGVTYTGFKNGENAGVIDTPASVTTLADAASPEGDYTLTPLGATDNNYDFIYVDGILSITPETIVVPPSPTPSQPSPGSTPVLSNGSPPALLKALSNTRLLAPNKNIFFPAIIQEQLLGKPYEHFIEQDIFFEFDDTTDELWSFLESDIYADYYTEEELRIVLLDEQLFRKGALRH